MVRGRLRDGRSTLGRELAERERRVAEPEARNLAQLAGKPVEIDLTDRLELALGGLHGALDVRLVGVGEAVCLRSDRRDDRVFVEPQRPRSRSGEREQIGDRFARFRIGNRVARTLGDAKFDSVRAATSARKLRSSPAAQREARDAPLEDPRDSPLPGTPHGGKRFCSTSGRPRAWAGA